MIILGAGLSGLICAALNAQAQVYERNPSDFVSHRAVLRFRDDKIARALGLTFRKVTVRKAIWFHGKEVVPTPRIANLYSQKVRSVIAENSIWNIAHSERFIAPDDLHQILADICGDRVHWDTDITSKMLRDLLDRSSIISTIPILFLLKLLGIETSLTFNYQSITVYRYRVPGCDVFQTVYYPDPEQGIYRATLTGDLLTVESSGGNEHFAEVGLAFGIDSKLFMSATAPHRQSFGKIAPVDDGARKALLHRLTQEFGVYSLGRFAVWRNILLDDVFEDIASIRRMITQSHYDNTLEMTK